MSTKLSPVTGLTSPHVALSCPPPAATARVVIVGEVDLTTAPVLRERLLGVLHDQIPSVLDVDLARVTFLDCAGIGALVGVHNAAVHAGCQMRVSHPQPFVRRVLEVTGLLEVFTAATVEPPPPPPAPEQPPGPRAVPAAVADPHRLLVAA